MKIARFEKRVIAYIIDIALSLSIVVGLYFGLHLNVNLSLSWTVVLVFLVGGFIYFLFGFPIVYFSNGRTVGSFIMGLKAVHIRESHITWKAALIRSMGISVIAMVIVNAFYMLTVHTNRTIFDNLSGTYVIDVRKKE